MRLKPAKRLGTKTKISFTHTSDELSIEIETQRLYIRSYKQEDFADCVSLYGDQDITQYFDHGQPRSENEVQALVEEKGEKYFNAGQPFGLFSIFYKHDMSFLGQIDLLPTNEPGIAEIGFILHAKYQNQGFCTEAIKAFLSDLVEEINDRGYSCNGKPISEIIATAHPKNEASIALLKKVGMSLKKFQERFNNPRLWYSYPLHPQGT